MACIGDFCALQADEGIIVSAHSRHGQVQGLYRIAIYSTAVQCVVSDGNKGDLIFTTVYRRRCYDWFSCCSSQKLPVTCL